MAHIPQLRKKAQDPTTTGRNCMCATIRMVQRWTEMKKTLTLTQMLRPLIPAQEVRVSALVAVVKRAAPEP